MEAKEIRITPPEGYVIDNENSTFDCIKFKPVAPAHRFKDYDGSFYIEGYFIPDNSEITDCGPMTNIYANKNVFATEKQAKSALAMAQISQIMANEKMYGKPFTDEEWKEVKIKKYCIERYANKVITHEYELRYQFLAFHTEEQRELFLSENMQLIKDYLMID